MQDFYLKYILDYEANIWAALNWYKELNQILEGKKVLHLHCFESNKDIRSNLQGINVQHNDLLQLSKFNTLENQKLMNHSCNHFTEAGNQILAQMLYACILHDKDLIDPRAFD